MKMMRRRQRREAGESSEMSEPSKKGVVRRTSGANVGTQTREKNGNRWTLLHRGTQLATASTCSPNPRAPQPPLAMVTAWSRSFTLLPTALCSAPLRTAPVAYVTLPPTSAPFSTTQTEMSLPFSASSCLRRIAADSPAGPAPTIRTSYSIASRSELSSSWSSSDNSAAVQSPRLTGVTVDARLVRANTPTPRVALRKSIVRCVETTARKGRVGGKCRSDKMPGEEEVMRG